SSTDSSKYVLPSFYVFNSAAAWPPGRNWIPTDDPFGYLPGSIDSLPQLAISRIPAWCDNDVRVVVDKTIDYETADANVAWKKRALLYIHDTDDEGNSGLIARAHADSIKTFFSPALNYNYAVEQLNASEYVTNTTGLRNGFISSFNAGLGYVF